MAKTFQELLVIHTVPHPRVGLFAFGLCAMLAFPAFAQAQSSTYQQEVQACRSGKSAQDRETCLEEARNAQAERRRGQLGKEGADYTANAMARCQSMTGDDLKDCRARVLGSGTTSGSVAGGGVLRQVETVVAPAGAGEVRGQTKAPGTGVTAPSK